jgi:hypothetical protein
MVKLRGITAPHERLFNLFVAAAAKVTSYLQQQGRNRQRTAGE